MKKKIKSKLSKKYVTDGELLKDMRDQLIVELPKLTRRRATATILFYIFVLGFVALFFIDCGKTGSQEPCGVQTPEGAQVTIVKLPEPDWQEYGLTAAPDHWRIPNPVGRSCCVFDIALTAETVAYQRTYVRALSQDLAGEARLDLLETPLVINRATTLLITPADIAPENLPVRAAIIRTCALRIADRQIPLRTFVDPHTHHGSLKVDIAPGCGQPRFDKNLSVAFTRVLKFVKTAASQRPRTQDAPATDP